MYTFQFGFFVRVRAFLFANENCSIISTLETNDTNVAPDGLFYALCAISTYITMLLLIQINTEILMAIKSTPQ